MRNLVLKYALAVLSAAGSALLLFSCDGNGRPEDTPVDETMMTEYSDNLSIVMSQNGRRSYHFEAPQVEGYALAREPYREFRKGVKITTYHNDSLTTVNAVLTANYAIYYINRELWEAKGNVVVEKSDGKCLYTQQLFWNARTHRIYSNVDSKFVQGEGRSALVGEGFESDEEFNFWRFRRVKGYMEVDITPSERADSADVAEKPEPRKPVAETPAAPSPKERPALKDKPLFQERDATASERKAVSDKAVEMKLEPADREFKAGNREPRRRPQAPEVPAEKRKLE